MESSEKWTCFRCKTVLPSPDGSRAPVSCLESLGGCGRSTDDEENYTRFFPSDWGEAKMELYVDADIKDGYRLFREVVQTIDKYFKLPDDEALGKLASLFVFQTYFARPVLSSVFYLGIDGPMSSGKTTLLEILRDLSWEGMMSGDVSPAALSRILDRGCTLFIDEADEMNEERRDLVYGSARRGYRRNSTRILSIPNGKTWEPHSINIFGCYAFSFYNGSDVDAALLSRMVKLDVERLRTDEVNERVFLNMARAILGQGDLKSRIAAFCQEILKDWTPQKAADALLVPEFQARAMRLTGVTEMTRDLEIAGTMLLISDMIGIDLTTELKSIFASEARPAVDAGNNDELEAIRDIFGPEIVQAEKTGKAAKMRFEEFRIKWNAYRKTLGDKPESGPELRQRLARLGFRAGKEIVHPKNRWAVLWTDNLESRLNETVQKFANPGLSKYLGDSNPVIDRVTEVSTQVDRVRAILYIGLSENGNVSAIPKEGLTLDEVMNRLSGIKGVVRSEIESTLLHLQEIGDVLCPAYGRWKKA